MGAAPEDDKPITFRLAKELRASLEERASEAGTSANLLAREMVQAHLADERGRELARQLDGLQGELVSLRSDVATVLELLLLNLTEVSKDDVRRFVSERMRS